MAAATARIKTALTTIVDIFPIIHVSIGIPCLYDFTVFSFMFVVSFVASL